MQIAIFSANLVLAEKVEHFGMETLAWRVGRAGLERLDRLCAKLIEQLSESWMDPAASILGT